MPRAARLVPVRKTTVMLRCGSVRIASWHRNITDVFRPRRGRRTRFASYAGSLREPSCWHPCQQSAACGRVKTVRRRADGPPTAPRMPFSICSGPTLTSKLATHAPVFHVHGSRSKSL